MAAITECFDFLETAVQKKIPLLASLIAVSGLFISGLGTAGLATDVGTVARLDVSLSESDLHESCEWQLHKTLHKNGFSVTDEPERIDAVLVVTIEGTDRSIGKGADFRAEVQGKGDKIIWHHHGREIAWTATGLCEDVVKEIVYELEDFRDNIIKH